MARASDGESALHKHLRVLEAFDAFRPYLTLSEIARHAGLAASTAHRLVAQLEEEGLLERLPDRSYRLGVRLWEFAARTPGALGLRELARPWMSGVHARVRQHTQLAVRSGRDVLFIERMSTTDAVINATLIGGRTPLPVSSSGLVLLAHAGDDLVDDVIAAGWPRFTAHTVRDGDALRALLRRVRSQGFADLRGHIHDVCAASPYPSADRTRSSMRPWAWSCAMTIARRRRSSRCSRSPPPASAAPCRRPTCPMTRWDTGGCARCSAGHGPRWTTSPVSTRSTPPSCEPSVV